MDNSNVVNFPETRQLSPMTAVSRAGVAIMNAQRGCVDPTVSDLLSQARRCVEDATIELLIDGAL